MEPASRALESVTKDGDSAVVVTQQPKIEEYEEKENSDVTPHRQNSDCCNCKCTDYACYQAIQGCAECLIGAMCLLCLSACPN